MLLRLLQLCIRLAHLRGGQATAVDRDVQLQAHRRLLDVATVRLAEAVGVTEAQRIVVAFLVFRHGVEGRCMTGLALLEGFFGGADGVVAREQVEVLFGRRIDPGLGVVRCWRQDRQGMGNTPDRVVLTVGQGDQGFECIIHLALGDDSIGACSVVAGLRLQHIGLVRETDIEAFVGLIELAFECGFLGFGRGQVVLGAQNVEIASGGLQNQVLLGRRELQCSLFVDVLGGLELKPAIGTEQWLSQCRLIGMSVTVGGGRRLIKRSAHAGHFGAAREIGQQAGAGLGHDFFLGTILGDGGGEVGVIVLRFLVDADQIVFGR